jgi:hypothetical protein
MGAVSRLLGSLKFIPASLQGCVRCKNCINTCLNPMIREIHIVIVTRGKSSSSSDISSF